MNIAAYFRPHIDASLIHRRIGYAAGGGGGGGDNSTSHDIDVTCAGGGGGHGTCPDIPFIDGDNGTAPGVPLVHPPPAPCAVRVSSCTCTRAFAAHVHLRL
jgi:hypothetical protein